MGGSYGDRKTRCPVCGEWLFSYNMFFFSPCATKATPDQDRKVRETFAKAKAAVAA